MAFCQSANALLLIHVCTYIRVPPHFSTFSTFLFFFFFNFDLLFVYLDGLLLPTIVGVLGKGRKQAGHFPTFLNQRKICLAELH